MKTEPEVFSFEDLVASSGHQAPWDGVRNYQARNMMRDEFSPGDQVLVYHSRIEPPAAIGIGEVVGRAYPDPSALNPRSPYFDEKSAQLGASRWLMVDIRAIARFETPVTIDWCRAQKSLSAMALLKRGQRLSIQPVSKAEWQIICGHGKPQPIA
jgi:predicted RNA-binding protein with PUA-like domain